MKFRELITENKQVSSGLLLYKKDATGEIKFFIVHPGGPFYKNKQDGHWTIPKGLVEPGEELEETAKREFIEETGNMIQFLDDTINLGTVKMKSGKVVHAFGYEADSENGNISFKKSNTFEIEWPKDSGIMQEFPEVDKGDWFNMNDVKQKIHPVQIPFFERLVDEI